MSMSDASFITQSRRWRFLLFALLLAQVVIGGGITLLARLAPFEGNISSFVYVWLILNGLSILLLLLGWGFLLLQWIRAHTWIPFLETLLLPIVGTIIGYFLSIGQSQLSPWNSLSWDEVIYEIHTILGLLTALAVYPIVSIAGFWLWITLFWASMPSPASSTPRKRWQQQAIWSCKVLSIALIALAITMISINYQHNTPFHQTIGNMCGPEGQPGLGCVVNVPGGGFPLPYFLLYHPFGDDFFASAFFVIDLASFSLVLWGGMILVEQLAKKCLQQTPKLSHMTSPE